MNKIVDIKTKLSKLTHTTPGSPNEKKILKELKMPALSRNVAINILLEMLDVAKSKVFAQCKKCQYFYPNSKRCYLLEFDGQYTENCPEFAESSVKNGSPKT